MYFPASLWAWGSKTSIDAFPLRFDIQGYDMEWCCYARYCFLAFTMMWNVLSKESHSLGLVGISSCLVSQDCSASDARVFRQKFVIWWIMKLLTSCHWVESISCWLIYGANWAASCREHLSEIESWRPFICCQIVMKSWLTQPDIPAKELDKAWWYCLQGSCLGTRCLSWWRPSDIKSWAKVVNPMNPTFASWDEY